MPPWQAATTNSSGLRATLATNSTRRPTPWRTARRAPTRRVAHPMVVPASVPPPPVVKAPLPGARRTLRLPQPRLLRASPPPPRMPTCPWRSSPPPRLRTPSAAWRACAYPACCAPPPPWMHPTRRQSAPARSSWRSPRSVPPNAMRRPWLASRRPPARLPPRRLRRRTTWPVWKSLPGSTRTMWIPPNCWVRAQSFRSPQKPLHLRKPPPPRPLLPSRLLLSPLFPHLLSPPCLLCLPYSRPPPRRVPRMPPPPNSCWKAEAPSWTRLSWTPCSTSAWCG